MNFRKSIISLLFLLTYSAGFAHNLLPHAHSNEYLIDVFDHKENHHLHKVADNIFDHKHIAHKGHYDNLLIDFLICLITESNHTSSGNFEILHSNTSVYSIKNISKFNNSFLQATCIQLLENRVSAVSKKREGTFFYLAPQVNNTYLRGPPIRF